MATYAQLLLDAGGGVINRATMAKQGEDAHVIIGLGGTGGDCVRQIKKEVYRQIQPDDPEAVIPEYKNIKFLIIDSDSTRFSLSTDMVSEINKDTEFLSISMNYCFSEIFANKSALSKRRELDWLSYDTISTLFYCTDDSSAQCNCGIRQIGRFLLVNRSEEVYQKIFSFIQDVSIECKGTINIHICSGLCGATGSGTFLDVCYLVKKAVHELGLYNSRVSGYFFLPDVNLAKTEVSVDDPLSEYIKTNGYAALKELDYCMSFGKNGDSFKMNYGSFQIEMQEQPVDLCCLISATNQAGEVLPNGYDYAMQVVTDFIVSFILDVTSNWQPKATFTLAGHISNLNSVRTMIRLGNGADIPYNILGVSVAEIPSADVATYVGAKLFEQYDAIFERTPLEGERDDFIKRNHLTYDEIKRAFIKGCMEEVDFGDLSANDYKNSGNRPFITVANRFLSINQGVMETNYQQFSEELNDYYKPKNSTSLVSRTFATLINDYVVNSDYGPIFASRLLMGNHNQNLIHYVDGLIACNKDQLEYVYRQHDLRESELKIMTERVERMTLLNQNQKVQEYKHALSEWYVQLYHEETLKKLHDLLNVYRDQLVKLQSEFFSTLEQVMFTLRETSQVNMKSLTTANEKQGHHWKILSLQNKNVRDGLDKEVLSIDLSQNYRALMEELLNQYKEWIANDANKITKLITNLIFDSFNTIANKTIVSYLEDAYNTTDPEALKDKIKKNIIQNHLEKNSEPMFWMNPTFNKEVGMQNTLSVPHASKPIVDAAEDYIADKLHFQIRLSSTNDKISVVRIYSGLPLYAYQGLRKMEEAYENDRLPGRHLFERRERKEYDSQEFFDAAIDWNDLPSPIPASICESSERIRIRNKELLSMFEKAEQLGIVFEKNKEYFIRVTEDYDVEQFIEENGGLYTNGIFDENKARVMIERLTTKKEMINEISEVKIQRCSSMLGSERTVAIDFFLKSNKFNQFVSSEIKKNERYEQAIQHISEAYNNYKKNKLERWYFFRALFSQTIDYSNTIRFLYEEDGEEKVFILQDNSMPFGNSGAYQAFLTFVDMNNTSEGSYIKSRINALTVEKYDGEEYVEINKAYVEKLLVIMPIRIETYMLSYGPEHPQHAEMVDFYKEMMEELINYKDKLESL